MPLTPGDSCRRSRAKIPVHGKRIAHPSGNEGSPTRHVGCSSNGPRYGRDGCPGRCLWVLFVASPLQSDSGLYKLFGSDIPASRHAVRPSLGYGLLPISATRAGICMGGSGIAHCEHGHRSCDARKSRVLIRLSVTRGFTSAQRTSPSEIEFEGSRPALQTAHD